MPNNCLPHTPKTYLRRSRRASSATLRGIACSRGRVSSTVASLTRSRAAAWKSRNGALSYSSSRKQRFGDVLLLLLHTPKLSNNCRTTVEELPRNLRIGPNSVNTGLAVLLTFWPIWDQLGRGCPRVAQSPERGSSENSLQNGFQSSDLDEQLLPWARKEARGTNFRPIPALTAHFATNLRTTLAPDFSPLPGDPPNRPPFAGADPQFFVQGWPSPAKSRGHAMRRRRAQGYPHTDTEKGHPHCPTETQLLSPRSNCMAHRLQRGGEHSHDNNARGQMQAIPDLTRRKPLSHARHTKLRAYATPRPVRPRLWP